MPPERTDKTEGNASRERGDPLLTRGISVVRGHIAVVIAAFVVLMSAVEVNHHEVGVVRGYGLLCQSGDTYAHTWVKWGWPITYCVDERWLWPKKIPGFPLFIRSTLSAERRRSSFIALAANYLTFLAIFGIAAFLIAAYYRRQFTLRGLFALIFCTAVILSALSSAPILGLSESQQPPVLSEFR